MSIGFFTQEGKALEGLEIGWFSWPFLGVFVYTAHPQVFYLHLSTINVSFALLCLKIRSSEHFLCLQIFSFSRKVPFRNLPTAPQRCAGVVTLHGFSLLYLLSWWSGP